MKNTFQNIYRIFLGNFGGIKKDESRQLTCDPRSIQIKQRHALARDIAVTSVIGLHRSDQVSDVICASIL